VTGALTLDDLYVIAIVKLRTDEIKHWRASIEG
jgi:hypothetical protein